MAKKGKKERRAVPERWVEKTGHSVEEAVRAALADLEIEESEALIEVLEEPKGGFLGIGFKPARVKVTKKLSEAEKVEDIVHDFFAHVDPSLRANVLFQDQTYLVNLETENPGRIIGKHGETVNSLQFLLQSILAKKGIRAHLMLDVGDFRARREEALKETALRLAERVRKLGRPYTFPPMPSMERRLIHIALQDRTDVRTYSVGEEPYRKVVIEPTQGNSSKQATNSSPSSTPISPLAPNRKWLPPVRKNTTPGKRSYRYLRKLR